MHYKRNQKHGSPEYRWGGRIIGRACMHCDRPCIARGFCMRHYQMWKKHGDPLYADKKKMNNMPNGLHKRKNGYIFVSPVPEVMMRANPITSPMVEKTDRPSFSFIVNQGPRDGTKKNRCVRQHRAVAGAKKGEIVHHIDLNPVNNVYENLHVFKSPKEHALAHCSLEHEAAKLIQCGLLIFNRSTGFYEIESAMVNEFLQYHSSKPLSASS